MTKITKPMASSPAAAKKFLITFGYNNFTQGPNKRIAKFEERVIKINDAAVTTTNLIRHLKASLAINM